MNGLSLPRLQQEAPGRAANKIIMENETDESLVTYMGFNDDEPAVAEAAAGELYRRYSRKMTAWCARSFRLYRQNHEDLVKKTFQKALRAAKRFGPLGRNLSDADKTRHIKFWLYCILKNVCIDAHRSEKAEREERCGLDVENVEDVVALDPADTEAAEPATHRRAELIRAFVASLAPHDQAILYNTMQYYDRRTGQTVMPKAVLETLCAELGMTKISLRTQRSRLLERMRQYVLENE
jgi:RNA polymerase sigma factor (sigma-70 family)